MTTVREALNEGLARLLAKDERAVLLGEDIADPYGGAFGVTRGLSTRFPGRVLATPVSEAGLTGVAVGMAIRGLHPVVEVMFGDFLWLAADQLVNHAARFGPLSGGRVTVPLTLRTPMGGRRGYGPTHSQSLEKHFLGIPGLTVVAPSVFASPDALLQAAHDLDAPVLFIENKRMYGRQIHTRDTVRGFHCTTTPPPWPTVTLSADRRRADLALVACGDMAEHALDAAWNLLMQKEICIDLVVPSRLSPLDLAPIQAAVRRAGRLLVCEEGSPEAGFGAEVIARLVAEDLPRLTTPPRRLGARPMPIFAAPTLEEAILPTVEDITHAIEATLR